jgi:hypothetical protein
MSPHGGQNANDQLVMNFTLYGINLNVVYRVNVGFYGDGVSDQLGSLSAYCHRLMDPLDGASAVSLHSRTCHRKQQH